MLFARPLYFTFSIGVLLLGGEDLAFAESATDRNRFDTAIAQTLPASSAEARTLHDFYRARGFRPAWSALPAERRAALISGIKDLATADGLDPTAYSVNETPDAVVSDLRLSEALLHLGHDLAIGRVAPDRALGGTGKSRGGFDGLRFLRALADGRPLADQATQIRPPFVGPARLRQALEMLRDVARMGGWPSLPDGPKIIPSETDERVPLLRRRLIVSGDLAPEFTSDSPVFDAVLVEAVRRFQTRHGLEPDGTVGARTLATLNVSAEERARQIALNLERWRWLGHLPARHVLVNIAGANLDLVEGGVVTQSMRVVIGDVGHPTPGMVTRMGSLVLNPPWSVPASIAAREILPKLQHNPRYLATSNLKIVEYPSDSPESAGDGIDWNALGGRFPYRLRQSPGPDNALGRLKFNLRESEDIYLHDTPNRRVFARANRALSHGCIRLEKPVELAEMLLGTQWRGRLDAALDTDHSTRTLRLEESIPVYLLYWTAWVDGDGTLQFRDDVYGHDRRLRAALAHPTPPPPPSPRS